MAKEIPLSRGLVALVDDEDYERLAAFRWSAVRGRRGDFYASRAVRPGEGLGVQTRQMQRDVLDPEGLVSGKVLADHENYNTLDNRRGNLRWLSKERSNRHRRLFLSSTSGYRGVNYDEYHQRWNVRIKAGGRVICGGKFRTREEAALAYNALALEHHGPDANLNVLPAGYELPPLPDRPARLQKSKGWEPPPHTKTVAASSRWANPFPFSQHGREGALALYRNALLSPDAKRVLGFTCDDVRRDLRGKNLACPCAIGWPCHADFLLEIANG